MITGDLVDNGPDHCLSAAKPVGDSYFPAVKSPGGRSVEIRKWHYAPLTVKIVDFESLQEGNIRYNLEIY